MESCRTQGLAGTNVQVAGVYGPWGETFTIAPLRQLQTGRVALVNGGEGVSNATYVDDVVQALLLAGCKDAAVGETFIVKGSGRITRRELYEAYQRMLGTDSLVSMTIEEIEQARKREKREALINVVPSALSVLKGDKAFRSSFRASHFGNLYQFLRNHTPALAESLRKRSGSDANTAREAASDEVRPLILPPPFFTKYLSAKIEFSAAKAERLLGFAPRYSFAEGMALTEQWARWARLIPEPAVSHITVAV
jgi:nucleoside-diphosphate-sugar epimerase